MSREEVIDTLRKIGLFIAGEVEELEVLDRREEREQYDYRMNNIRAAVGTIFEMTDKIEKEA